MARVDSLLKLLVQQDGDEAWIEIGHTPRLTKKGQPVRLFFPVVGELMFDQLVGDLLTPDRRAELEASGEASFTYAAPGIDTFEASFIGKDGRVLWMGRRGAVPPHRATAPPSPPADEPPPDMPTSKRRKGLYDPEKAFPTAAFAPANLRRAAALAATHAEAVPTDVVPTEAEPSDVGPAEAPPLRPPAARADTSPPEPRPRSSRPAVLGPQLLQWLHVAAQRGASDLHLAHGELPTLRLHSRLVPLTDEDPVDADALFGSMTTGARAVDKTLSIEGVGRVRLHLYRAERGLCAALRLLPEVADLDTLGLGVDLEPLARLDHGLVLVGGPTGAGKSTTLAALATRALHLRGRLMVSLEDPIEREISAPPGSVVRQREVGRHVPDMAAGLRDALREDPDILMLGELRDPDAILAALTAAETGQLVMATIHCRSAANAIDRVLDALPPARQGQARAQLAEAVRAVVVQRLLPAREGRVVAVEVLRGTRAVAALIREGKTAQLNSTIATGAAEGMTSMERSLAERVRRGQLRREVALTACNDAEVLRAFLDGPG